MAYPLVIWPNSFGSVPKAWPHQSYISTFRLDIWQPIARGQQ